MPITDQFIGHELEFCAVKPVLVDETRIKDTLTSPAIGTVTGGPNVIDTNTFLVSFDFEPSASGATLVIKPAGTATATPCYFLPYKPDCCITMVLGGGANYFFTSTLTGCSVQAFGPLTAPTLSHSNGRAEYAANLAAKTAAADDTASGIAQTKIDSMFPDPTGAAHVGYCRKADYRAKLTKGSFKAARGQITAFSKKVAPTMVEGYKPEIGAFVFGKRVGTTWSFYYQSTVGVTGSYRTSVFGAKHNLINREVVLGMPTRFYPYAR